MPRETVHPFSSGLKSFDLYINGQPWKGDLDQVKMITFSSISSVGMQSIFKMDSRVERSIQPVFAAYHENLLTCKLSTSQAVEG